MDWLLGVARFIFFETIFGTLVVAALASILASGLVWLFRLKQHGPAIIAACTILAGLGHLSYSLGEERYRFERETLTQLQAAPWVEIVETQEWGDLVAPRTWFDTPVGFFKVAQPDVLSGWSPEEPVMQVTVLAFGQEPSQALADVSCADRTARWAFPDSSGKLVYGTNEWSSISEQEYQVYCRTEWEPKIRRMLEATSNGMN